MLVAGLVTCWILKAGFGETLRREEMTVLSAPIVAAAMQIGLLDITPILGSC